MAKRETFAYAQGFRVNVACTSGVSTQMKLGRQILKLGSRGTFYITTVTITIIIITIIASNDGVKS